MNLEQKFLNGLDVLAEKCKCKLTDWDYDAFTSVFRPIGFDKGIEAIKIAFMKLRGNSNMPSPMDMMEFIGIKIPEAPSARDEASNIAANIINAIGSFGGYKAREAAAHLGPEIWSVVEGFGGWETLCMIDNDDVPTIRAQLRDLAESKKKIAYHQNNQLSGGKDRQFIDSVVSDLVSYKNNKK